MSATVMDDRGSAPRAEMQCDLCEATIRWMRTSLVRNGVGPIFFRGVLVPSLLTIAGALFMVLGPVPIRPGPAGGIHDRDVVFLFLGYLLLGQLVLIVSGAWLHLRDVHSRSLGGTYTAVPDRRAVVGGTALIAAAVGALGALVSAMGAVLTFVVFAHADLGATMSSPRLVQTLIALPIGTALLSIVAVGVAVLVRQPIAAACLLVVWATYGEDAVGLIPGVGPVAKALLPITNSQVAAGIQDVQGISSSPVIASAWMAVVAAGTITVATVVECRRRGWVSG